MSITINRRPVGSPAVLADENLHPVLADIYVRRGIQSVQQLERGLAHLLPLGQLKGVESAAELLAAAVMSHNAFLLSGILIVMVPPARRWLCVPCTCWVRHRWIIWCRIVLTMVTG